MSDLERAIEIAATAHRGQQGKGGEPLVLHPLRMMLRCADDALRQVAVLHDVVERSEWTLDDLRAEGFAANVVEAVEALTKREGEAYLDYVRRAARLPLAARVKVLDLEDHVARLQALADAPDREQKLARYAQALEVLAECAGS
jgi:(p)ppGpp synthase/HD superfamily hydrolase